MKTKFDGLFKYHAGGDNKLQINFARPNYKKHHRLSSMQLQQQVATNDKYS